MNCTGHWNTPIKQVFQLQTSCHELTEFNRDMLNKHVWRSLLAQLLSVVCTVAIVCQQPTAQLSSGKCSFLYSNLVRICAALHLPIPLSCLLWLAQVALLRDDRNGFGSSWVNKGSANPSPPLRSCSWDLSLSLPLALSFTLIPTPTQTFPSSTFIFHGYILFTLCGLLWTRKTEHAWICFW